MEFAPREITLTNGRRVLLRRAEPSDAPAHWEFMQRLRASTPYVVTAPDESVPSEKLAEDLATFHDRPGALYLIALPIDQPGFVAGDCVIKPFKERKMAHVANMGMGCDERWRGCGLGTAMLSAVLEYAEAHPELLRVELGVMRDNAVARRLYQRLGFVEHGVLPSRFRQPGGAYSDEVMMGRWVNPRPED